jgi:predicted  nucleic acid-binding Zn-ribbon protein
MIERVSRPPGVRLCSAGLLPAAAAKKRATAACRLLRNPPKMIRASLALKLLLLAFMAAVCVLASNLDAFLYMNRYVWFRKARNAAAFFFIFLGHLSASAFATISGSNEKPRTDEIHFATVVILQLFSVGLLVWTLSALFNDATDHFARKKLKSADNEVQSVVRALVAVTDLVSNIPPASLTPLGPEAQLPLNPTLEQAQAFETAAEERKNKVQQDTEKLQNVLKEAETTLDELTKLSERLDRVRSECSSLQARYSVLAKQPDFETLRTTHALIGRTAVDVADQSAQLSNKRKSYAESLQRSIERSRDARAELDKAAAAIKDCKRRAEEAKQRLEDAQRDAKIEQQQPTVRNARVKAVVICLLVASLWIAVEHANPLSHAPRTSSKLTQLALLENYFQKSQFSNYIMVVLLETVGA